MRFFTQEVYDAWYEGGDNQPQHDTWNDFVQHIGSLRDRLSPELIELATLPGIDDGTIRAVHRIHATQQIILILACGNSEVGVYDLVLTYDHASITKEHEKILQRLAKAYSTGYPWKPRTGQMKRERRKKLQYLDGVPDLYRQEIDITETGNFVHRLMFHPGYWFAIECRSFQWQKITPPRLKPDRSIICL